jgi:hypothetical protein
VLFPVQKEISIYSLHAAHKSRDDGDNITATSHTEALDFIYLLHLTMATIAHIYGATANLRLN